MSAAILNTPPDGHTPEQIEQIRSGFKGFVEKLQALAADLTPAGTAPQHLITYAGEYIYKNLPRKWYSTVGQGPAVVREFSLGTHTIYYNWQYAFFIVDDACILPTAEFENHTNRHERIALYCPNPQDPENAPAIPDRFIQHLQKWIESDGFPSYKAALIENEPEG